MKKTRFLQLLPLLAVWTLISCSSIPKNASPVQHFEVQKYLGQWYEIARMDFRFERNLSNVTATYSLQNNGRIRVDNKGYDVKQKKWKQAIGKAKFAGSPNTGMLKVSFFGPFYSGYNVIAIDPDYKYALVLGKNTNYLWILARETKIPEDIQKKYLQIAEHLGCDISSLIWTDHTPVNQ